MKTAWLLAYLLNSLWQLPLLFAAGWLAARALRPLGAAAEHRVWVAVVLLQTLLPALAPAPFSGIETSIVAPIAAWLAAWLPWHAAPPAAGDVSVTLGPGIVRGALPLPALLFTAIACLYAAACAAFALRFVLRAIRLRALRTAAVPLAADSDASRLGTEYAAQFGLSRVTLATAPHLFAPVTIGCRRALVLLPRSMASQLPVSDLRAVLAHEFAHIRRRDFLKNLFYELLALPVSYHPFSQAARARLMESREMVCDHAAAALGGRRAYAQSLLRLASLLLQAPPAQTSHAIGIFGANTFERRVMRLAQPIPSPGAARRLLLLSACALLALGTCASALALHLRVDGLTAAADVAAPTGPVHVSPGVMQGQRIGGVMPVYPPEAKKKKVQGTVVLDATIDKDGHVQDLRVVSGPDLLRDSATTAVKQWTYKPYLLNGEPVAVTTTIHVIYSLGDKLPAKLPKD